ncbi:OLC1v1033964C1 [Oldenlandia corymbosa var. corymbosa]|uniref:glutamate carboxypeptidase II n=1 Tax=Oldenlandia corymbosa var. corymbosa TaxID=529605 RepID=A0AAV1CSA8_OLDCO|nr:OLC1v1033964C1 [Oldenlandia corymbosa var. corymbosa]
MPNIIKPNLILLSKFTLPVLLILTLFILTFSNTRHHSATTTSTVTPQRKANHALHFQDVFLSTSSNYTLATYLRHLTLHPHLAGTPPALQTALYVRNHFESLGLETHTSNHTVLLSYPLYSSLTAHFRNGSTVKLPLSEPGLSPGRHVVSPYHAYSPSGSVLGRPVFLNYGRGQDYAELGKNGVEVKGCIGIVRRGGGLSRNDAVEKAAAHGVAAVLMYTEGEEFRGGVERGTVMKGVGDPLSPGWAGVDGGERLKLHDPLVTERFPNVPSMPVSADTAEIILGSMELSRVPKQWREAVKSSRDKFGRAGPGPDLLNFTYMGEKKMATIHNIFVVIRGLEEPDRFVLLGNHRDAWTYGAVDPNSGTSALLDVARRFALMMRLGWSPRRTIILGSWDAEEFGMIGSTEWVEKNLVNLGAKAVAYLNVDCAVQGPGFFARATPQLDDLLIRVTKKVTDPDSNKISIFEKSTVTNEGFSIQRLSGVDSDFAPFLQHAGVPSIDMYYGRDFPVYHTAFDSYEWMANVGDPSFQRHVAVSGVWGLLALHLADDPILPFNYLPYAAQLQEYVNSLSTVLSGDILLHPITLAIQDFRAAATEVVQESKKLLSDKSTVEDAVMKMRMLNDRLMLAERGFLDPEGLCGSAWFKHLIYGPQINGECEFNFFPGIADAISESKWTDKDKYKRQEAIQHEVWRVARAIQRAAVMLEVDRESVLHVLRDCPAAKKIWHRLVPRIVHQSLQPMKLARTKDINSRPPKKLGKKEESSAKPCRRSATTSIPAATPSNTPPTAAPSPSVHSASTTFVQCLNRKVSSASADLNLLESMSCDTVSFEELLGHCYQVYHDNQSHLLSLQQHLISNSAYVPTSVDTDEDQDEEERDSDGYACISSSSLPSSGFPDDPLLDDSLNLNSLGLSDVSLATIASGANGGITVEGQYQFSEKLFPEIREDILDEPLPSKESKLRIDVSRVDYDSLPEQIKRLASWEELLAAVEKMNSSLAKRSADADIFHQDEIPSLGLGDKARSHLLLLIKMNRMAVEPVGGAIYYRVL